MRQYFILQRRGLLLSEIFKQKNKYCILVGTTYIRFKRKEVIKIIQDSVCVHGFYEQCEGYKEVYISFIHQ